MVDSTKADDAHATASRSSVNEASLPVDEDPMEMEGVSIHDPVSLNGDSEMIDSRISSPDQVPSHGPNSLEDSEMVDADTADNFLPASIRPQHLSVSQAEDDDLEMGNANPVSSSSPSHNNAAGSGDDGTLRDADRQEYSVWDNMSAEEIESIERDILLLAASDDTEDPAQGASLDFPNTAPSSGYPMVPEGEPETNNGPAPATETDDAHVPQPGNVEAASNGDPGSFVDGHWERFPEFPGSDDDDDGDQSGLNVDNAPEVPPTIAPETEPDQHCGNTPEVRPDTTDQSESSQHGVNTTSVQSFDVDWSAGIESDEYSARLDFAIRDYARHQGEGEPRSGGVIEAVVNIKVMPLSSILAT